MASLKELVDQAAWTTSKDSDHDQESILCESIPMAWPVLESPALYGLAGDITRAAIENSEADPAAVLVTTLVYAGAAFGTNCYLDIGDTKHSPRLMAAIVGASGRARKGTSTNPVKRIFETAEKEHNLPLLKVSSGPLSSGEGIAYAVRDPGEKLNKEGELEDAGVADKRLLVLEGELGAPLKAMQREGNTLSAIIRNAWDNGNIEPLTKSNRIKTTNAHICIVGHITRQELTNLLKTSEIWNGFANRLLWVCARRQKLVPLPIPMDIGIVQNLASRLAEVIKSSERYGSFELDSETKDIWKQVYKTVSRDESGVFGAITARAEAQVMRLSLIYALLDGSNTIRTIHLRASLALWQYCLHSARYIFGTSENDPHTKKILQALSKGEKSQTQLSNLFNGHLPAEQLKKILTELQSMGLIEQQKRGGKRGQGKVTTIWFLKSTTSYMNEESEDLEDFEEKHNL
ncbi:MAG: DUF3987 domain-containing protein [Candidatus Obscuribacterales bacterium]|nr:DUF3987 domain-containing protein [Candidatus Obscuribacterales bacterium]